MKILLVFITLFLFTDLYPKANEPKIKSRVKFQKGLSVNDLSGWEKEFFQGLFEEFEAEVIPDENEEPDNESEPSEKIKIIKKKKVNKVSKAGKMIQQIRKKKELAAEMPDIEERVEDTTPPVQIENHPEPVKKTVKKQRDEKPLTEMEVEKFEEIPDETENEVDRTDRIRKMKELLKKRKGKKRIEDRRIY